MGHFPAGLPQAAPATDLFPGNSVLRRSSGRRVRRGVPRRSPKRPLHCSRGAMQLDDRQVLPPSMEADFQRQPDDYATAQYTYDSNNVVTGITYANGQSLSFSYNTNPASDPQIPTDIVGQVNTVTTVCYSNLKTVKTAVDNLGRALYVRPRSAAATSRTRRRTSVPAAVSPPSAIPATARRPANWSSIPPATTRTPVPAATPPLTRPITCSSTTPAIAPCAA